MPMTRHTIADHLAVEHAKGREQGGRAIGLHGEAPAAASLREPFGFSSH